MNKRELLIEKYTEDLKSKFNITADVNLLRQIAIGCGPSIYNADSATVSSSDEKELMTVKNSFLIKKLGLADSENLMDAIQNVMLKYGKTNRSKYRVVVYYLLTLHFNKQSVYL